VGGTLFMADEDVTDGVIEEGIVGGHDGAAWIPEDDVDPLSDQGFPQDLCTCQSHVTAPSDAELTRRAYLPMTPRAFCGGGLNPARRGSRSARTSRRRARTSKRMMSPSRTKAIGPPITASGATWPAMKP